MSLSSQLKTAIPPSIRIRLRRYRRTAALHGLRRDWDAAAKLLMLRQADRPLKRLLILPSDPWTLTGALGDDAMIGSCIQAARALNPLVVVHTITADRNASQHALARGLVPEELWERRDYLAAVAKLLNENDFDACAALGADIMDGYYSPLTTAKMLATCDLVGRSGVPTTILGFSFNANPCLDLLPDFSRVHQNVRFHVRDTISMERFRAFAGRPSVLVSDSAFPLIAEAPDEETLKWIAARRSEGRSVIGVNVHPMIIENASEAQIGAIIARTVRTIERASRERALAWLALPHDYRGNDGDARCLTPIVEQLRGHPDIAVRLIEGRHSAAFLKGVAGALDGVITGRMHLAIGSLSMGVPTLCLTYQDKFEGLYRHFDLPNWLLLSPDEFLSDVKFAERLDRFLGGLDGLRTLIRYRQADVLALSRENFALFA